MGVILSPINAKSITRFRTAQDRQWPQIAREIAVGRKRTHWMWYVFPQLKVLAKSEVAQYYGIVDKAEALAYLDEPVLRLRLAESAMAVLGHKRIMFNDVDRRKLHASMTLFREVVADPAVPNAVLSKYFGGEGHQLTMDVLEGKEIPQQWTAMGRVEVGKHWEKGIKRAQADVAAVGAREPRGDADAMSRREVESFIAGFHLSTTAKARIVAEWMADQERAREAGWQAGEDSRWHDDY